jgi:Ca2+-binding RTX toxin-like protein
MGNDIFVSSPANETFTGVGGNDTFVFTPGFGQDTITDFHPGDTIQIDHTIFADFNSLISHAQTVGANTVITDAASNSITLAHIALANLHANDFHFV